MVFGRGLHHHHARPEPLPVGADEDLALHALDVDLQDVNLAVNVFGPHVAQRTRLDIEGDELLTLLAIVVDRVFVRCCGATILEGGLEQGHSLSLV